MVRLSHIYSGLAAAGDNAAESENVGNALADSIANADPTYIEHKLEEFLDVCLNFALKFLAALIVFIIGVSVIKFLLRHLKVKRKLTHIDDTVRRFTFSFIRIALYTMLAISVIAIMGVPMSSVVAVIASAGVAIGLALQGALSNLAGGIMILIFKPFRVGDSIESGDVVGTVEEVSLFYTIVRTYTNQRITAPNSSLSNTRVINNSVYRTRRVDIEFPVSNTCAPDVAAGAILEVAKAHPAVFGSPEPQIIVTGYSRIALIYTLRVWCDWDNTVKVKSDLLEQVYVALAAAGIEIKAKL